ncbi:hypothetical protein C8R45DRAFT_1103139 [Mycena sanguinolenta]|nr:hypothetical protein C8R45DRAFT_1103139 [Mycena sanguinolenta]
MRFISSLYTYCSLVWAVYATPIPVPQDTTGSVEQRDPIIRAADVFQPIALGRAAQIDVEGSIEGRDPPCPPNNPDCDGSYCVIA